MNALWKILEVSGLQPSSMYSDHWTWKNSTSELFIQNHLHDGIFKVAFHLCVCVCTTNGRGTEGSLHGSKMATHLCLMPDWNHISIFLVCLLGVCKENCACNLEPLKSTV
jgi:hypothetical protein